MTFLPSCQSIHLERRCASKHFTRASDESDEFLIQRVILTNFVILQDSKALINKTQYSDSLSVRGIFSEVAPQLSQLHISFPQFKK